MVASRLFNSGQCPHPINREGRKDSPSAQLATIYKKFFISSAIYPESIKMTRIFD
jgi:hypothetical protein